jgi:hypothetical protein
MDTRLHSVLAQEYKMANLVKLLLGLIFISQTGYSGGQNHSRPFYNEARIEQNGDQVSIRAYAPRPLDQVIEGLRSRFRWEIDYEDPIYGDTELIDNTDPKWRSEHPVSKGVTRVAGGTFEATFIVPKEEGDNHLQQEVAILNKIVQAYNDTSNPGRFEVKHENKDRLAIVGISDTRSDGNSKVITPVLDARIALPPGDYIVADAITRILQLVSQKTGHTIAPGWWPTNIVIQSRIKIDGREQMARQLLSQICSSTRLPLLWRLLFDGDTGAYFFSLSTVDQRH